MSKMHVCDGCGAKAPIGYNEIPNDWLIVSARDSGNRAVVEGEFHSLDCFARFVASQRLDKAIKRGEAVAA